MTLHRLAVLFLLPLLACLVCPAAHAWSGGHAGQTREILDRLPPAIVAELPPETREEALRVWSKYPDNFDPIDPALVGDEAVELLASHGVEKRYHLHKDEVRAVMFALLVDALREKRMDRAAFWVTAIGHAAGDMAASNHDPLVQKIIYHWIVGKFDATLVGGGAMAPMSDLLDLEWTAEDAEGQRVFADTIDRLRIPDDGRGVEEALQEIMLYGHEGARYMGVRTGPMIEAAAEHLRSGDAESQRRVWELASEMGAWAVVRVLRDLEVAQRLADAGEVIRPDQAVFERFGEAERRFVKERPMSDSLYEGLSTELPGDGTPVVGVLAEPLWRMDESFLGYNLRVAAAAVANSLHDAGRDHVLIDVRRLLDGDLPDPSAMPVLVVPVDSPRQSWNGLDRSEFNRRLEAWADAGGKILWLGGRPTDAVPAIEEAMGDSGEFGTPDDAMDEQEVVLLDGNEAHRWRMGTQPKPVAGWGRTGLKKFFDRSADLEPVLVWRNAGAGPEGEGTTIGVVALDPDGEARHAFLPHRALWMHLLEDPRVIEDPARATLDAVGTPIFLHTLGRLLGEKSAPAAAAAAAAPPSVIAAAAPDGRAELTGPNPRQPLPDLDPAAHVPPVTVDGEHLLREGELVRFWGINTNLQPWVTADSVDATVDRMAAMGFNAIRFWPNREAFYGVEPADEDAPEQGLRFVDAERGDGSLLDLYDRMTARAKRRGVAIYNPALLYYPPYFADFVDIVETDSADRAAWEEALRDKSRDEVYNLFRVAQFFDERCQAIMLAHATNYLDHVNPYTGIRNADENNFAVWDLCNESRFVWQMLLDNRFRGDGSRGFGPYFTGKLKQRFNEWLAERYPDTAALESAWGGLEPGERLGEGSVEPGTESPTGDDYGSARVRDFTAFAVDVIERWTARFIEHARARASSPDRGIAVAAINADTVHVPNLPNYLAATAGTSVAISTYPAPQQFMPGGGRDPESPRFPWDPLVDQPYGLRIFNLLRPAGKPLFVYETNYNGFGLYDAEYPWIMAGYAAWQDYAGVFWHNFNHPGPSDIPDPFGEQAFAHQDFEVWGDEVSSSALGAAGEAFKRGVLPTAEQPATFTFSRDAAVDPDWVSFRHEGDDPPRVSGVDAGDAGRLDDLIEQTAYRQGHRIAFRDGATVAVSVSGLNTIAVGGDASIEPADGLRWDWADGRFVIDRPEAKAWTGFPDGSPIRWDGGFELSGYAGPFLSAGLVSLDGRPLASSDRMLLSVVGHEHHKDMHLVKGGKSRDEAALDWTELDGVTMAPGDGPVVIERPGFTLTLPPQPGRRAVLYDFGLHVIGERDASKRLTVSPDEPVMKVLLVAPD